MDMHMGMDMDIDTDMGHDMVQSYAHPSLCARPRGEV